MTFAAKVKEELSRQVSPARHCQIAEMAAIISLCGKIMISADNRYAIKIVTENVAVARKYFTLLKKTFNIVTDVSIQKSSFGKSNRIYAVVIKEHQQAVNVLQAAKLLNPDGGIGENLSVKKNLVVRQTCCRRAFIRGAFLASGSISDPEKSYHFEITCATRQKAEQLTGIIASFGLEAKSVIRKKYYVVYLKDGCQIVDMLNIMEAPVALMDLENIRILKEMRGQVNRQVNCETANIKKCVSAAMKQVEDIQLIDKMIGCLSLPENLAEIASLRLEKPEATLKELGEMLSPPVGKSGVNHRLRKLGQIAESLRSAE